MNKYIVLYHMSDEEMRESQEEKSSLDRQESMVKWMEWKESIGNSLIEFGSPVKKGARLRLGGLSDCKQSEVVGYTIVQANTIEQAQKLFENHPHMTWGDSCEIELFEFI